MTAQPSVAETTAPARPRSAVLADAWRALGPGVEVFSAADGGPLRRAEKCLIDPLVLRVRANPDLGAPLPDAAAAARIGAAIADHAAVLRRAALWFDECKRARRRRRITAGNAQELYFPLAFELAVTVGAPGPGAAARAEAALLDLHDGDPAAEVTALLDRPGRAAEYERVLRAAWDDVGATPPPEPGAPAAFRALLARALPRDPDAGESVRRDADRAWRTVLAGDLAFRLGARAHAAPLPAPFGQVDAGLAESEPPPVPALTGTRDRPLDRSVAQRVRATLRRAGAEDLPGPEVLLAEELDRAAAPWGLLAEDGQAALVAGLAIAAGLRPLDPAGEQVCGLGEVIAARLRSEAYVLHARRCLGSGAALHPRQEKVVAELREFRRPYAARLWARLHGRDTAQTPTDDVTEVRELLTGVARSVSLDHRQAIKRMLQEAS